jgi:hypothetical protein
MNLTKLIGAFAFFFLGGLRIIYAADNMDIFFGVLLLAVAHKLGDH